ncbi:MAG: pyridoxal phosphate-dependent aminotransferase [Bdellovibrionales bacterium]|nr:pyridoxal phosphate-dependent aminotransferase [Bdellovibrionales bacterium]
MISKRARSVDTSGIRRVFDLAAQLTDPINLSIGQPDFDAAPAVKLAAKAAIDEGKSRYTVTQGIPELRAALRSRYELTDEQDVFVTAGVSGGLLLSYLTLLDPGDQILVPDPFFCIYRDLALMVNAETVYYDTYPDFRSTAERIERALTPQVKAIIVNTPGNPTGVASTQSEVDDIVELARRHNLVLIYDEIYDAFCYDEPHPRCLDRYENTILLNGFSKSAGVPGWRIGYVAGPKPLLSQMTKLQQYTLVCANSVAQWAMIEALEVDYSEQLQAYRKKRDFVVAALEDVLELVKPGGAFYVFPKAPGGSGQQFVERCIKENLLLVPGSVFSRRDTHFRLSFSAPMETLERGVEVIRRLVS